MFNKKVKIKAPLKLIPNKNPNSSTPIYPPKILITTDIPLENMVKNEVEAVAALGWSPKIHITGTILIDPPNPTNPLINPLPNPLKINLLIPNLAILVS